MRSLVIIGCCLGILTSCQPTSQTSEIPSRPAPVFSGVDQRGAPFSSDVLRGKPWIASFFFTTCQTVCPLLNAEQKKLVEEYGGQVRFVSISTDPDVDTGATLAAYAHEYDAKPGTWWMIHMPGDSMRTLSTQGFRLMDPKEPAMHSTRFATVDAHGQICGYYDSTDPKDLQKLRTWINSQL